MPRNGSGVYSKVTGTTAVPVTTIESSKYNSQVDDLVADANLPRPIVAGGTGASSEATARTALGLAIGTNVQAWDADLDGIAGLAKVAGKTLRVNSGGTAYELNSTAEDLGTNHRRQITPAMPTANNYTFNAHATIGAYEIGQRFLFRPNATNTGAATLDVNSLGPQPIIKWQKGATAIAQALDPGDLEQGSLVGLFYDGTQFVLIRDHNLVTQAELTSEAAAQNRVLAWVNFNGQGTVAIRDSYNVSSITDNGVGDFTINFATALPHADYLTLGSAPSNTTANNSAIVEKSTVASPNQVPQTKTVSAVRVQASQTNGSVLQDLIHNYVMIIG